MRKITIIFLSFVLLFNINSFAQKNDPILQKLLNAAGDKMYLKEHLFNYRKLWQKIRRRYISFTEYQRM